MFPGPDRSDCYLQGIRRAEQDGLIDYARKKIDAQCVVADDYSHICDADGGLLLSLRYTNTRPLSFVARQILNLYRNRSDVRFLELGPGAGVACAAVSRLLPDAKIDTVSLTPLNPYLRFRWDDVYDHIAKLRLQEKYPLRFYESCSPPFVHNQYIGRFPGESRPQEKKYHVIYEDHGAIFYNFQLNGNDEAADLARASISSALSLLRSDGTMLIMASDGSYGMEDTLESIAAAGDVIVTCRRTTAYHSCPCIVAREESPLSARLRGGKDRLLAKSERVLRLESRTMEEVVSQTCAGENG